MPPAERDVVQNPLASADSDEKAEKEEAAAAAEFAQAPPPGLDRPKEYPSAPKEYGLFCCWCCCWPCFPKGPQDGAA